MIRRLLIANRGEIAVRIIRTCREMGIESLAVYSDADRNAMHVRLADRSANIGPAAAAESYLNIDAILGAARQLGADAVHPGYGFLSESAEFAQRCADSGIVFVGPPAAAMRLLGDKIEARRLAASIGIPIAPGYDGDDQADRTLTARATKIGYPVLIKSAAGGGGRGMRLVRAASNLPQMLAEARAESLAACGDSRLLLEKYIASPHHVEIQVLADSGGNVVHLFERECSVQRRNQKIVEETPSPVLTAKLRKATTETAVKIVKAAGYANAGTVEFLVETANGASRNFYFLEVNTRIQVEHPITEAVTGIDLVRKQIEIASGMPLGLSQNDITAHGHAIEARIYAEDPAAGFLPSAGTIKRWIEPSGPGIRVDAGYESGDEVTPNYDSMLAKVTAHAESRPAAIAKLRAALEQFCILGVRTNTAYLIDILDHPAFIAGDTPTTFLAENMVGWTGAHDLPDDVLLAAAAQALTRPTPTAGARQSHGPWQSTTGWRNV